MTTVNNEQSAAALTTKQRFTAWLFPAMHLPPPPDVKGYADGYLTSTTDLRFGMANRLRFLISGRIRVIMHTKTDATVKDAQSVSTGFICPPGGAP